MDTLKKLGIVAVVLGIVAVIARTARRIMGGSEADAAE